VVPFLAAARRDASFAASLLDLLEQIRMISGLCAQEEVHPMLFQVADVRSVTGQAVLDHDQFQVRMFRADLRQQASRGVPLAVVLVAAVAVLDRLASQGNDLLAIGMHDHGREHLVLVGDRSVLMLPDQAAAERCLRETAGATEAMGNPIIPMVGIPRAKSSQLKATSVHVFSVPVYESLPRHPPLLRHFLQERELLCRT
jgi:hypothetical protein